MSPSTETRLRERMTAYADTIASTGPDLAGAAATARRQRRSRSAAVAGATVAVVAVAAVGVGTATAHRADRVHPSARPDTVGAPLPGYARAAADVSVPADLDIFAATEAGGQVWAVASDPGDNEPILLHAAAGGMLQQVHRYPYDDVSDERLAIRGGHVLVVSTENDVSGSPQQDALLTVYDARTTAVLRTTDLTTTYAAAGAYLGAADGGTGPLTVLLAGRGAPDGDQRLRAGVVAADGTISGLTSAVDVPESPFGVGAHPPDFLQLQLVTSTAGRPRCVFVAGGTSSVRRLDLTTGALTPVVVDRAAAGTGLGAEALGVVDGRVLYESAHGYDEGVVSSDRPTAVPDSDRDVGRDQQVEVFGDRPYLIRFGTVTQTAQALDPRTLQPDGPTAVSPLGSIVDGQDAVVMVHRPQSEATGVGGTLTAYAPI